LDMVLLLLLSGEAITTGDLPPIEQAVGQTTLTGDPWEMARNGPE